MVSHASAWKVVGLAAAILGGVAGPRRAASATPEVLRSWDFETGPQGWRVWSNVQAEQAAPAGRAHSGKQALWGRVATDGVLVHLVEGLDFPVAGATLRLWYLVPPDSTFDHLDLNLRTQEHGPQANPIFQLSMGLRKGQWTLVELPFTDFFGWTERAYAGFHVREFEVAATGKGELLLDDVSVVQDREAAARADRVPSVIWLPGEDATKVPGGRWGRFRRTFSLDRLPRHAWLQVGADDEATVWVNDVELGKVGLTPATEFDLSGRLRVGKNVVAVAVLNHGSQPNPSGAVAVLGWGDARPDEVVLVSDASWRSSPDAPDGWTRPDFDDSAWQGAAVAAKVPAPPWSAVEIYPLQAPVDRTAPEVRLEFGGGRTELWAVITRPAEAGSAVPYSARLSRLASDLTAKPVGTTEGALPAGQHEQRLKLFSVAALSGAHQVEITFPGRERGFRQVVWLPGKPPGPFSLATRFKARGTGFFRTEKIGGRWWLVDPEGSLFFSLSCNAVIQQPYWSWHYHRTVTEHYLDLAAWGEFACRRLLDWGFNSSTGADSGLEPYQRRRVPYFVGWNLLWAGPWLKNRDGQAVQFPDIFDPEWRRGAEARVKEVTDQYRDDPLVIGYFTDNEIMMHAPLSPTQGIMDCFWSPGAQAELLRWLQARYEGDIGRLNRAWTSGRHTYTYSSFDDLPRDKPTIRGDGDPVAPDLEAFCRHVIGAYAETYVALWKQHDPNHLVFSNRFAGTFDTRFADLLRPYDVIACNSYPRSYWGQTEFDSEQLQWLRAMHRATDRPVLISEWGVTARDSGLPNFWGRLDTQQQRGEAYSKVLPQLWDEGYVVGAHWFSWGDSTDAERRNWGIVDAFDRPYRPLVEAMTRTNHDLTRRVHDWQPGRG